MTRIFFYGLFMDRALLVEKGLHPKVLGPAVLPDYRIHIGDRATLVPSASSRAFGIVMELSEEDAHALYAEPSVRAYQPERVRVTLLGSNEVVEADCYNLPGDSGLAGANPAYASELSRLVEAVGFDSGYVREIAAFGKRGTMTLRAALVLLLAVAFAAAPFLTPGFGGYDPSQFPVPLENPPVQPAGYAFSIWLPIYLWLIVGGAFGLWRRRDDPAWDATRPPLILSLAVGVSWLAVALASPIWATVLIWVMLGGALAALLRTPNRDAWLLRESVGLYAGWLTAASAVSLGLLAPGWGVPPFGPVGWAFVALVVGLVVAVATLLRRPSLMYGVAVGWALAAVTVRNGMEPLGIFAAVAAMAIVGLTLARRAQDGMGPAPSP